MQHGSCSGLRIASSSAHWSKALRPSGFLSRFHRCCLQIRSRAALAPISPQSRSILFTSSRCCCQTSLVSWSMSSGGSMTTPSASHIATSPLVSLLLLLQAPRTAPAQTSLSRGQPEGETSKMLLLRLVKVAPPLGQKLSRWREGCARVWRLPCGLARPLPPSPHTSFQPCAVFVQLFEPSWKNP